MKNRFPHLTAQWRYMFVLLMPKRIPASGTDVIPVSTVHHTQVSVREMSDVLSISFLQFYLEAAQVTSGYLKVILCVFTKVCWKGSFGSSRSHLILVPHVFLCKVSFSGPSLRIQMERQPVRFVRGPFDGFSQDSQEAKRRG